MGNFGNRIGNTAAIPVRLAGTGVITGTDLVSTFSTMGKEAKEIVSNTSQSIKEVLFSPWNKGKWYNKVVNVPGSIIKAVGTGIEGAVRSAVQPVINGVANTWNTGKNMVKNARKGTFSRVFSKKPISDFSYNHLETRESDLKQNRFSKLQFGKKKDKSKKVEKESTPVIEPVAVKEEGSEKMEKPKVEKTKKEKNNKENEDKKIDEAELSKINTLPKMAAHLGVKENENMIKHKKDIIEQMKEGKPIKDSLIQYDDEARKIVGPLKGDAFAKGNIAIDLLKSNIISEGMKTITNKNEKYKKEMEKYLKENIDTAKTHLRNNNLDELAKKLN